MVFKGSGRKTGWKGLFLVVAMKRVRLRLRERLRLRAWLYCWERSESRDWIQEG